MGQHWPRCRELVSHKPAFQHQNDRAGFFNRAPRQMVSRALVRHRPARRKFGEVGADEGGTWFPFPCKLRAGVLVFTHMQMGVPRVLPPNVPERICTVSGSRRGDTMRDWPGRRRSRSGWMSASESLRRGGQPSTITPTPPPWDSPHVVMRKRWPKVFAMQKVCGKGRLRSMRANRQ